MDFNALVKSNNFTSLKTSATFAGKFSTALWIRSCCNLQPRLIFPSLSFICQTGWKGWLCFISETKLFLHHSVLS
ncbi:hypothetical protein F0562_014341 [Nyssa sinensis]|uniref:Uncharacterized protein n=1 Tax=Nyssa sinensis TaxID=561372 RepID=A0A5J4ZN60_9ASTE|nr:hypothetical protein F0562_014341 [Nyssa sinensis]